LDDKPCEKEFPFPIPYFPLLVSQIFTPTVFYLYMVSGIKKAGMNWVYREGFVSWIFPV